MKVLVVHNQYQQKGGEDKAVENELKLLQGAGIQTVPYFQSNTSIIGTPAKLKTALSVSFNPASYRAIRALLQREKADLVQVHNVFPRITPSVFYACQEEGVPVVLTLHNYRLFCANGLFLRDQKSCELCLPGSVLPALRYRCYRGSLTATLPVANMIRQHRKKGTWTQQVDHFFVLSQFSKEKFIRGGLSPQKITVKPNFAFESAAFQIRPSYREKFLYVGRLSEEKGIQTLLRAWKHLPYSLKVVGEGPLKEWCAQNASPNVELYGPLPSEQVRNLMQASDALIVPSECFENFPLVIAEAYALGLPVIGSKTGALAELIENGKTGFHFETANSADLERITRLFSQTVSDLRIYARMQTAARECFLENYSAEKNLKILLGVYENLRK